MCQAAAMRLTAIKAVARPRSIDGVGCVVSCGYDKQQPEAYVMYEPRLQGDE